MFLLPITQDIVAEIGDKPHILGVDLRKVYIMFLLKTVEKLRIHGQKHKKLDFLQINVIMDATREI